MIIIRRPLLKGELNPPKKNDGTIPIPSCYLCKNKPYYSCEVVGLFRFRACTKCLERLEIPLNELARRTDNRMQRLLKGSLNISISL